MDGRSKFQTLCAFTLIAALGHAPSQAFGQADGFRFQPPRAPTPMELDDFDDEDTFDLTDEPPPRPPMPGGTAGGSGGFAPVPVGPGGSPGNGGPPPEFRPQQPYSRTTSAKDFRFQVVEGEYWEKGKKRTRGTKTQVTSNAGDYKHR